MLLVSKHEDRLGRLADQVRSAQAGTPALMADVIAEACTRLPGLNRAGKAGRIDQLIDDGAWTDAALLLIELELPAWTLRRLVRDDDAWVCSLSRQPDLPAALDDTADACHGDLPLAILGAFLEAKRRSVAAQGTASRSVPHVRPETRCGVCCDNFA
jgi:hypothetical protein